MKRIRELEVEEAAILRALIVQVLNHTLFPRVAKPEQRAIASVV